MKASNLVVSASSHRMRQLALILIAMSWIAADPSMAQEPSRQASDSDAGQGSLAELGAKLSNPLSDV